MVLHLLGKKSWNVYNTTNVERVRRDEAAARAQAEAEEQRMQDEDTAARTAILRGEPVPAAAVVPHRERNRERDQPRERKRRKLRGEDDTDRDIRFAREDAAGKKESLPRLLKQESGDAPLTDHAGHVQLFSAPSDSKPPSHNEKPAPPKRQEPSQPATFNTLAKPQPWYASNKPAASLPTSSTIPPAALSEVPEKNVWGRPDPNRKAREETRIASSDPFAAMQQAQRQLKQSRGDKEAWSAERERERERECEERSEKKRRRRRDSLEEGFSLDAPIVKERKRHHRHHHHRRHGSRERDKDERRKRERD